MVIAQAGQYLWDIAAHLHKHATRLSVVSIVLNSSPIGKGPTDKSQRGINVMNAMMSVNEDLVYYERGHRFVEVINRSDRYYDEIVVAKATFSSYPR